MFMNSSQKEFIHTLTYDLDIAVPRRKVNINKQKLMGHTWNQ
jgi:hypothetical protein